MSLADLPDFAAATGSDEAAGFAFFSITEAAAGADFWVFGFGLAGDSTVLDGLPPCVNPR